MHRRLKLESRICGGIQAGTTRIWRSFWVVDQ